LHSKIFVHQQSHSEKTLDDSIYYSMYWMINQSINIH